MPLVENTLFEEVDKVQIAIKRIQEFEPEEGYYLAFSGGKDSQTIYELAKMSGVKFDAYFNLTTIDPPEVVNFIKYEYPEVKIHIPDESMWSLILRKKSIPTRISRFCCEVLKERGGVDRFVMTGVRWAESNKRKNRKLVENCFKYKYKKYLNPIIDWEDSDVWGFLALRKIQWCSLYDEGYWRIGCIMCPLSGTKGMLRDKIRFPKYYKKYLRTFDRIINRRKEEGLELNFKTSEDMMHWWIYGKEHKRNPDQTVIFE